MNCSRALIITMCILHLIFPFAIYRSVYSSPVPPNVIKTRVEPPLLALLLTFGSLLFVLFCTKWLYILRRRQAQKAGGSRATLRSGWYDNFSTSSSRFFMGSGDAKSGFLIGLLGSPAWETRYSAVILDHHSLLHESSVSGCRSASGLSIASQGNKSCSFPCGSAQPRSPVPEENTPMANNARPMSPPSPAVTINRSPLLSDNEYMRLLNGRVSATLPFGVTPLMNPSPTTKDLCQPCNPKVLGMPSSVSARGTIQAINSRSTGGGDPTTNNPTSVSETKTPSPTSKPTNDPSLDDTGMYLHAQPPSAEQEPLSSVVAPLPKPVQRFESTLAGINDRSSNGVPPQSVETPSKPCAPSFRSKTIHPKHFLSLRSFRSTPHTPKIGPSPLRTVILPPEGCPETFQTFSSNRHHHQLNPPAHDLDPAAGLVLDLTQEVPSTQTPASKKCTDTDSLLELMAELAQETSAWDPNVFMDENFKKLMVWSKPQVPLHEKTARPRRHSWRSSRQRKVQHVFTTLEDIPEVDVTEMMPASTGDTAVHSFWSDEDDDRQFLISNRR